MQEDRHTIGGARIGIEACHRVARVVSLLAVLPAVPVRDWLDRAAGALASAAEGSTCVVLTARVDAMGTAVVVGSPGVGGASDDERASAVRVAARRLGHCGLSVRAGGVAIRVGMPAAWLGGALGRVLGPSIVAGAASIEGEWTMLVYIASECDAATTAAVLEAALPLAASAASRALGAAGGSWLTRREQGVLELVVRGMSDREAGAVLGRSPHTVHEHVKSLHQKLGTRRRAELAARYFGGP